MRVIEKNTKREFEIVLKKQTGEESLRCPACSDERKKSRLKCLGWSHQKNVGRCNHCEAIFYLKPQRRQVKMQRTFVRPKWNNKTELSNKLVKWFEGRCISQGTLKQMKITEGIEYMSNTEVNTIQFNYFCEGELLNIKYRSGSKLFKMVKDAEIILYNLDAIKETNEVIITEGEIDTLSFIEAGYENTISVPNGAVKGENNLQYLDICIDWFENKEKIYIAVDNDEAGLSLQKELIRRLGAEVCFIVDFDDCKDANEYLCKHGKTNLSGILKNAKEIKMEGVFTVEDFEEDLDDLWHNGLQPGLKLGYDDLDEHVTWEKGLLYIISGIPSHGKSYFIDEVTERLSVKYGWKTGYFSPENLPLQLHASKIISKLSGKYFNSTDLNEYGYIEAKVYLHQNFYFICPKDEGFSLDNILEKAKYLIKKYGIKCLVIDPWNRLEHQSKANETETNYVSRQLDRLTNFAKKNDILIILSAHPRKIEKIGKIYAVPNLYEISGSANFFNKCDFGITVYRDFVNDKIEIYVQKIRHTHLGTMGVVPSEFKFNKTNGRFTPIINDAIEHDYSNHLNKEKQIEMNYEKPKQNDLPF